MWSFRPHPFTKIIISNNILAQYIHMMNYSFHPFLSVRKVFFISLA
ncbi:hypothetical protein CSB66_1896 [Enterobacter hormaechei]|nr:hypothetical protein CSB66_1896 [Enterobacter hormaechei]